MKKEDKNNTGRSISEWEELAERYFDALTTLQEEEELRKFLGTPQASSPRFDEIKAVMGYFATRKAASSKRKGNTIWWSAAAIVAVLISTALWYSVPQPTHDICIAYVNGVKYTDDAVVMKEMQQTFRMMGNTAEEYSIEGQLYDMFNTINSF